MNQFSSIFGQILHVFSKREFYEAVRETKARKEQRASPRGGSSSPCSSASWARLALSGRSREASRAASASSSISASRMLPPVPRYPTPMRSGRGSSTRKCFTNSWPNAKLLRQGRSSAFKNKLFSLDASLIELCVSLFDWATYRRTKGAVKLHLLLDHDGYLPVFAHITEGSVHEINIAKGLSFPKGSIVVADRGYTDYKLFARWTSQGVFFVTRQKRNAQYKVIERRPVPRTGTSAKTRSLPSRVTMPRRTIPIP